MVKSLCLVATQYSSTVPAAQTTRSARLVEVAVVRGYILKVQVEMVEVMAGTANSEAQQADFQQKDREQLHANLVNLAVNYTLAVAVVVHIFQPKAPFTLLVVMAVAAMVLGVQGLTRHRQLEQVEQIPAAEVVAA